MTLHDLHSDLQNDVGIEMCINILHFACYNYAPRQPSIEIHSIIHNRVYKYIFDFFFFGVPDLLPVPKMSSISSIDCGRFFTAGGAAASFLPANKAGAAFFCCTGSDGGGGGGESTHKLSLASVATRFASASTGFFFFLAGAANGAAAAKLFSSVKAAKFGFSSAFPLL